MPSWFRGLLLFVCFTLITPVLGASVAAADKPIQLYMNGKKLAQVNPIVRSGVLYVPVRKFCEALGYTLTAEGGQITAVINGAKFSFQPGLDYIELTDTSIVGLAEPVPVIQGQSYLPLRLIGNLAKLSVDYDRQKNTVNLKPYGYGQETAIRELVTKYYDAFRPDLLTSDNPELMYYDPDYDYEANRIGKEVPVRDFRAIVHRIDYASPVEAKVQATYIRNTEVMDQQDEYVFKIRYEEGRWKIALSAWISDRLELPEDIEETAAAILEKRGEERKAVLLDLRTYYQAYNAEDLPLALRYTSPSFIRQWNAEEIVEWEDNQKEKFAYSDPRYRLSKERVVYIGEREAVVQGELAWTDPGLQLTGDTYVYPALIFMEYADGRWTYHHDLDLSQDFDWGREMAETF